MAKANTAQAIDLLNTVIETLLTMARWVIGVGIMFLLAGGVIAEFGFTSRWLPTAPHMSLAAWAVTYAALTWASKFSDSD